MGSPRRIELLGSPLFVLAVVLLVLNDFVLKATFHNWLTGKFSDFAGLTAVTIFANALWPERTRTIALSVSLGFIYWKSPGSQWLIDSVNGVSPVRFGRTVDYTDLIALPAVWIVSLSASRIRTWPARSWLLNAFAALSILAFAATSPSRYMVRESADIPASPDAAAAGRLESDLQALLDGLAAKHGLRCEVCDPLASGRVYALPTESSARDSQLLFATSLDPTSSRLLYDIEAGDYGKYPQMADSIRSDVTGSLVSAYPGLTIAKATYPKKAAGDRKLYVRRKGLFYKKSDFEADYAQAAAIVDRAASSRGLKRATLGVAGLHAAYYAGRLFGTYPEARELSVSVAGVNDDVWIEVRCYSSEYVDLQRTIADDLQERLRAEFGEDRVR